MGGFGAKEGSTTAFGLVEDLHVHPSTENCAVDCMTTSYKEAASV